jgi:hypothetical protein
MRSSPPSRAIPTSLSYQASRDSIRIAERTARPDLPATSETAHLDPYRQAGRTRGAAPTQPLLRRLFLLLPAANASTAVALSPLCRRCRRRAGLAPRPGRSVRAPPPPPQRACAPRSPALHPHAPALARPPARPPAGRLAPRCGGPPARTPTLTARPPLRPAREPKRRSHQLPARTLPPLRAWRAQRRGLLAQVERASTSATLAVCLSALHLYLGRRDVKEKRQLTTRTLPPLRAWRAQRQASSLAVCSASLRSKGNADERSNHCATAGSRPAKDSATDGERMRAGRAAGKGPAWRGRRSRPAAQCQRRLRSSRDGEAGGRDSSSCRAACRSPVVRTTVLSRARSRPCALLRIGEDLVSL